jgi:hypothetical protein
MKGFMKKDEEMVDNYVIMLQIEMFLTYPKLEGWYIPPF